MTSPTRTTGGARPHSSAGWEPRRGAAVIFDIDGTILRPGCRLQRAHMGAMAAAAAEVTGVPSAFRYRGGDLFVGEHSLSGYTDAGTIELLLRIAGVPREHRPEQLVRITETMCRRLAEDVGGLDCRGDLLYGVARLAAELRSAGVPVGLSTGNARAVAACKMGAVGLPGLEARGAFGDHHQAREDIVRDAVAGLRKEAAEDGRPLEPHDIVLVGDTPSDVRAARAAGIRCLAVATGAATEQLLREAGPDALAESLAEVSAADLMNPAARH
ncbi:HAD family hydrolase [Streptomyces sp. NBC_00209]|uniref:HAD family hydrolase n=1 Tax=Streptomyces sp. NBC_00209 TaxID=2975682 RepID=UPI0032456DCE